MSQTESAPRRKPRFRERNTAKTDTARRPSPTRSPLPASEPYVKKADVRSLHLVFPPLTLEHAIYAGILALGVAVRLWDVGSRAMHGDEAVHAWLAWNLYSGTGYQYDPVYHGPLQFIVTAGFFFLFGDSEVSARLMAVIFGSCLIALPIFLRAHIGRGAALLAAGFIAISPAFVYVSRLERDDIFTSFFALGMVICLFGFIRTQHRRYFYFGFAAVALSLAAMENTYITLFVFGTYSFIVGLSEWLAGSRFADFFDRKWGASGSEILVRWLFLAVGAALLVLAFILTIFSGLYLPVPLILGVIIIFFVHRQAFIAARNKRETPLLTALATVRRHEWLNAATIFVAILFISYSTFGTNLHGIWDSGQAFFNSGKACPGNPFVLNPCRKDIIGGLFYWLSQHPVHRGGQPWFYYVLLFGLYEQIALILGLAGILWFWRMPTTFTAFLTYWAILMFAVYSWAGEKFPWLMIHPLMPFVLMAALFVADLVRRAGKVRLVGVIVVVLLGALELHNVYEVNFVNGADPVEMMVYVQSSPDTPKVAANIEAISNKATNGPDVNVTIDSTDTWPFAWYLRHLTHVGYPGYPQLLGKGFADNPVIIVDESHQAALLPKLGGKYVGRSYTLRWWFPEDYKQLTWRQFFQDAANPGYWRVIADWQFARRPFGPKQSVRFYYYVKSGFVAPF
jgi:uncharacterized protein (TIGR03663 family)